MQNFHGNGERFAYEENGAYVDRLISIYAAKCMGCGYEFSATEVWNDGEEHAYPIPATVQFCRSELVHPAFYGGCGGRVALSQS